MADNEKRDAQEDARGHARQITDPHARAAVLYLIDGDGDGESSDKSSGKSSGKGGKK